MMRTSCVVFTKSPLLLVLVAAAWAQQIPHPQQIAILRQINHVNEDGSYTYGYEAADGSFKIETRDVSGTVRGMFGFVDENGRQRRVSYTAGNTTGFQTTGQPPTDDTPTPIPITPRVILAEHPVLRPIRPFPTVPVPSGNSAGRDSVAKLIRHLGIIGAKQAGSHRFLYPSDGSSTTTTSPVTTTTSTPDTKRDEGKSDPVTTRRPTVVQRIVRTRPRTESSSRKDDSASSSSRRQSETSTIRPTTEKPEEIVEKDEIRSAALDALHKRPVVALKVTENPVPPRFVILPSRILRWRPSSEEEEGKSRGEEERISFRPESFLRQRLVSLPAPKDTLRYRLRQLPREQLASPQTPLQIFTQKTELPPNFQDQQYLPQKNVFAFLSSTPRPRLVQPRPLPPSSPVHPEAYPGTYRQAYDVNESPNGVARFLINDGNYTPKIQQAQPYFPQHQTIYQQKPLLYNVDPHRYGPYYPRPNSFPPPPQSYTPYGQRGLIELLLAYLQLQPKSTAPQGEYTNQLQYDPNNIVPRPHYPQTGSGYQPPAILIPYPAPPEQFHGPFNNMATVPNNYELARLIDPRAVLRPTIIRQPIDVQNRAPRPILYGNGLDLPYLKNKENGYPVDFYVDPRNLNPRQGVAFRPAPLQFQPLFLESPTRSHTTPHQFDYPVYPARQSPAMSVTTVTPRSATEGSINMENQGLPYGFTKKFRSVEVISPENDETTQKTSKSD